MITRGLNVVQPCRDVALLSARMFFSPYGIEQKRARKGLSVARRRRERLARAGRGMQANAGMTRARQAGPLSAREYALDDVYICV